MRSLRPRLALVATLFLGTIATPSRAKGTVGPADLFGEPQPTDLFGEPATAPKRRRR